MLPELHLNVFHPAGWRGKLLSGSEKLVAMSGSPGLGKGRGDEIYIVRTAKPAVLYHTHPHPHGRLNNQFLLVALDVWEWACFQVARMNRYHYILSLEKARAPHSSTLAWKIPWAEEPGWAAVHGVTKSQTQPSNFSLFTFMHWRRKWQPTPVFLPEESQGWGSLVGCRLWGRTESDTTEAT